MLGRFGTYRASVFRVMTYNILNGGVDDGDSRLGLIHEIVASVKPDVLAIQEANEFDLRAHRRLFAFERAVGMRGLLERSASEYHGVEFLARHVQPIEHRVHPLITQSVSEVTTTGVGTQPMTVCSVHYDSIAPGVRLVGALYSLAAAPSIVMGDFSPLPEVRRYHAERGIPDAVSWASLAGLGRSMTLFGPSSPKTLWPVSLVFRSALYKLGRLEFDRGGVVSFDNAPAPNGVRPPRRGGYRVNVHIPDGGPLDPAACDESFATARAFFPRHFPEERFACFTCHSWLMDPQLAEYLPESSNIVRFQRRFHLLPSESEADRPPADSVFLELVFHRVHGGREIPADLLDGLPQETMLQRAVVTHLRAGRHWYNCTGWFPF